MTGGTQRKKLITGSVAVVKKKELAAAAKYGLFTIPMGGYVEMEGFEAEAAEKSGIETLR